MPPVNPQGSRGTLITAVVIFTILFVTATIFAIYFAVDDQKQKAALVQANDRSKIYYGETTGEQIKELLDERNNVNLKDRTALGAAVYKIDELERRIVGSQVPASNAAQGTISAADSAVARVNAELTKRSLTSVPTTSLVDTITALGDSLIKEHDTAVNANENEQQVVASAKAEIDKNEAALAEAKKISDQALADVETAKKSVSDMQAEKDKLLSDANAKMDKERDQFNVRLATAEKEKQDLNKKITGLSRDQARLIQKLASLRLNPQSLMVRRSEGHILSVASEDIVYIDLGQGDQIVPGMTFEVYNKHDGIPAMGDGLSEDNNTLPVGEASLEVQEVLATSSQCRVTKLEPGQHITEGDLIANLAYDRNTKYNFVVYGKFNLNPTSPVPTIADADIIKGLIVKWGGKVQDHVDVDTDFVVMGAEPKVKDYTADELSDPFVKNQHDKDLAEQQAYADVVDKAKDYSITIMNQNRFLYYTGYYPLAAR